MSILKFTRMNWVTFKKDVEVFFLLDGVWDVVLGTMPKPADLKDLDAWEAKDRCGYSLLYFLLGSNYHSIITELSSGSAAWNTLKGKYKKDSSATHLTLCNQFYTIHHDPSCPVSIFIDAIQSIAHQLKAINYAPGKNEVEDIILLCLDATFEPVWSSLITQKKSASLQDIITAVKEFEANQIIICISSGSTMVKKKEEEEEEEGNC